MATREELEIENIKKSKNSTPAPKKKTTVVEKKVTTEEQPQTEEESLVIGGGKQDDAELSPEEQYDALLKKAQGDVKLGRIPDPTAKFQENIKFLEIAEKYKAKLDSFMDSMLDVGSPEEMQKLRGQVGGDLQKDYQGAMVQFDPIKYKKARALSRTIFMSSMAGMMQAMAGTGKGIVGTAGGEGLSAGILDIQARQDIIDKENQQLNAKNAMMAREYYINADAWAKAYNEAYNTNEKIRNDFVIAAVKQKADLYKKVIDETSSQVEKFYTKAGEQEKEKNKFAIDIEKEKTERRKANIEAGKAEAEINKENRKIAIDILDKKIEFDKAVEKGFLTEESATELQALAAETDIPLPALINAKYLNMTPQQFASYGELNDGQANSAIKVIENIYKEDFFSLKRKSKASRATKFITTMWNNGWTFDQEGFAKIQEYFASGNDVKINSSAISGEIVTKDPMIKALFKDNRLIKSVKPYSSVSPDDLNNLLEDILRAKTANTDQKGKIIDERLEIQLNQKILKINDALNLSLAEPIDNKLGSANGAQRTLKTINYIKVLLDKNKTDPFGTYGARFSPVFEKKQQETE